MDAASLDEGRFAGQTVGLRVDINSPIGDDGTPADDTRFQAHLETIEELRQRDAAVVILAHQGRPGRDDFTSLDAHAAHLGDLLDLDVGFVDAVCSIDARRSITDLDEGEVLCLENVRFASEELLTLDATSPASTHLVERLSTVLDVYVNDAFAVAHRAQPSVVGFPDRLPSATGRLMAREVGILGGLDNTPRPRVAMLAGAKVDGSLSVLERLLADELVERVLVGGVVANAFFVATGADPDGAIRDDVVDRGYESAIDTARTLFDRFGDQIELPVDVVVPDNGGRLTVSLDAMSSDAVPRDVGPETIDAWAASLRSASTVICNGPVGRFEEERFAEGTAALFEAATAADRSIAGGGDTSAALRRFGIDGFSHVSTGGGASMALLSGTELPGIAALEACTFDLPS